MSIQAIEKFYLEVKNSKELQNELEKIKSEFLRGKLSPLNAENFVEKGLIPLAKKHGMLFSLDDLMDYASRHHASILERKMDLETSKSFDSVSGGSKSNDLHMLMLLQTIGI